MTDKITIPPEALEAGKDTAFAWLRSHVEDDVRVQHMTDEELTELVGAVCLAMLRAWPGMQHDPGALVTDTYRDPGKIILPSTKGTGNMTEFSSKDYANGYRDGTQSAGVTVAALRAEVERLKDANAQLQEIVNGDTAEEERIRAENEKLRAALSKISEYEIEEGCPCNACQHSAIARAALEEKQ